MEKKIKLKLDEIKVESFITSLEGMRIQGADYSYDGAGPGQCYTPPTTLPGGVCNTSPYPCYSDGGSGTGGTGSGNYTPTAMTCPTQAGVNTCQATCNYTNYGSCTCPPATANYTGCYC